MRTISHSTMKNNHNTHQWAPHTSNCSSHYSTCDLCWPGRLKLDCTSWPLWPRKLGQTRGVNLSVQPGQMHLQRKFGDPAKRVRVTCFVVQSGFFSRSVYARLQVWVQQLRFVPPWLTSRLTAFDHFVWKAQPVELKSVASKIMSTWNVQLFKQSCIHSHLQRMKNSSLSQSLKILLQHLIARWTGWVVVFRRSTLAQPNKVVCVPVVNHAKSHSCVFPHTFNSFCLPHTWFLCTKIKKCYASNLFMPTL